MAQQSSTRNLEHTTNDFFCPLTCSVMISSEKGVESSNSDLGSSHQVRLLLSTTGGTPVKDCFLEGYMFRYHFLSVRQNFVNTTVPLYPYPNLFVERATICIIFCYVMGNRGSFSWALDTSADGLKSIE